MADDSEAGCHWLANFVYPLLRSFVIRARQSVSCQLKRDGFSSRKGCFVELPTASASVIIIRPMFVKEHRDTRVVEFRSGVSQRPILRAANASEYLREGGTVLRLMLRTPPESPSGLLATYTEGVYWKLTDLVRWLCPASGVSIFAHEGGKEREAVRANDWVVIPGHELLKRLDNPPYRRPSAKALQRAGKQLQIITDPSGVPIARAGILSAKDHRYEFDGVVTVDGFRHCTLRGIQGVFAGTATVASRDSAIPLASAEELGLWATGQADILGEISDDESAVAAKIILSCRGSAENLRIVRTRGGWLTKSSFIPLRRLLTRSCLWKSTGQTWSHSLAISN